MLNVKYGSALCKFENGVYCLIFYNDLIQTDSRTPEEAGFVMQGLLGVLRLRIPSPSERSRWASPSLWLRWTTANRGTIQGCFSFSYQMTNRVYLSLLCSLSIQRELSSFLPVPTHSLFSWEPCPWRATSGLTAWPTPSLCVSDNSNGQCPKTQTCPLTSLTASEPIQAWAHWFCVPAPFSVSRGQCIVFVGRASREKLVHFRVSLMQKPWFFRRVFQY